MGDGDRADGEMNKRNEEVCTLDGWGCPSRLGFDLI